MAPRSLFHATGAGRSTSGVIMSQRILGDRGSGRQPADPAGFAHERRFRSHRSCGSRGGLAAVAAHRPDLVLMDIQLPGLTGMKRRTGSRLTRCSVRSLSSPSRPMDWPEILRSRRRGDRMSNCVVAGAEGPIVRAASGRALRASGLHAAPPLSQRYSPSNRRRNN
jgi:hypothetical protein